MRRTGCLTWSCTSVIAVDAVVITVVFIPHLRSPFFLKMCIRDRPQAVNEYLQTNNFRKVDTIKRDILNLYEDDFKKIDSTGKLSLLFDAIPAQLNLSYVFGY